MSLETIYYFHINYAYANIYKWKKPVTEINIIMYAERERI